MKYIKTLEAHLDHWKRLYAEHICEEKEGRETIEALQAAIKALQTEPCEDAISRQAVMNTIYRECSGENLNIDFAKVLLLQRKIKALQPVQPKPKTGHWEYVQYDGNPRIGNWHCSKCGRIVFLLKSQKFGENPLYDYCPWCGTKMEEGE